MTWRRLLAILLIGLAAPCRAASAQPRVLRVVQVAPLEEHTPDLLVSLVEGLSVGALTIESLDRSACRTSACADLVRLGQADVGLVGTEALVGWLPALEILELPYLFDSAAVVVRTFEGPFFSRLREALLAETGLYLLAVRADPGWRVWAASDRPIAAPTDVAGRTIWSGPSAGEARLVAALGGTPLRRDSAAPRVAIRPEAEGVEAALLPLARLAEIEWSAPVRFVTRDRHGPVLRWWLIRHDTWTALSIDARQVLQASVDEVTRQARQGAERRADAVVARLEEAGVEVHQPTADERRAFQMAAGRVTTTYMDDHGPDWLVWLEGAIAEAEVELGVGFAATPAGR